MARPESKSFSVMSHPYWLLWLVSAALGQVDDHPYCSIRYARLCQGKGPHVGCQFPHRRHGDSCENYSAITFTDSLKHFILHYINRRRQRVAAGHERVRGGIHLPKPEIMMLVQWDRELAFLAQRLADQCRFVHDDCRATVRYPYAGQAVGEVRWRRAGESTEEEARRTIGRVFDAWWGERRRVQPKQLTAPFTLTARGAVWGHFSQLTVWTLRGMGCGAVHHGTTRPRLLLVCDFSHTNMLGQKTISPGPLATCPLHTTRILSSHYPLLCSPVRYKEPQPEIYSDDEEEEDAQELTIRTHHTHEEPVELQTLKLRVTRPIRYEDDIIPEDQTEGIEDYREHVIHEKKMMSFEDLRDERREKLLREKIEREINQRNRELQKVHKAVEKFDVTTSWDTRRKEHRVSEEGREYDSNRQFTTLHEQWSDSDEDNEIGSSVIPLIKLTETQVHARDEATIVVYRPTSFAHTTSQHFFRQRWKRPRNRPRRPGANALINAPPSKVTRKSLKASFTLDPEDEDQLFHDTGFKVSRAS